jgi:hypothetical protein
MSPPRAESDPTSSFERFGRVFEAASEEALYLHGITLRTTKRVERVEGFDQALGFIIPDEFNPQVVIGAKITEEDGTARDKITLVQHLAALSTVGRPTAGAPKFEVIACIAGRGFRVGREDMKTLLLATRGKVFTLQNMPHLVRHTRLKEFQTRAI